MTRERAQLLVILAVIGLWLVGVVVNAFDGPVLLQTMTPVATGALGWLFAAKATGA